MEGISHRNMDDRSGTAGIRGQEQQRLFWNGNNTLSLLLIWTYLKPCILSFSLKKKTDFESYYYYNCFFPIFSKLLFLSEVEQNIWICYPCIKWEIWKLRNINLLKKQIFLKENKLFFYILIIYQGKMFFIFLMD